MKILFVGKFDPDYNRTKVIIDGLRYFPEVELSLYSYKRKRNIKLSKLKDECHRADVIFLPSFTHLDVPLIRAITRKPIIFDPLISRYLTKVFDYKKVYRYSPRAFKNFLKDKISMSLADVVICDTDAHKKYFENKFNIPQRKLKVIPVGVNTDEFKPPLITRKTGKFIVGFYGSFIPLHGTKFIVEAAKILSGFQDIHFTLVGEGFEFKQIKTLALDTFGLTNISFPGWVDYTTLNDHIATFDIALGIFGETLKADLVIPNKIYHYAALQKAIITKASPAIREIFEDGMNLILTDSDPEKIAESILKLYTNCEQKNRIAVNGYDKVTKEYNHIETAKKLLEIVKTLEKDS